MKRVFKVAAVVCVVFVVTLSVVIMTTVIREPVWDSTPISADHEVAIKELIENAPESK